MVPADLNCYFSELHKPPPETPEHVRDSYDEAVTTLNTRWNLKLPRYHFRDATAEQNEDPIIRKCTSRIRWACYHSKVNLPSLLDDFEEYAKLLRSSWVFKPQQVAGTLPRLPKTKSQLFKDSLATPFRPTEHQRKDLLDHLLQLLEDEYKLWRDSKLYERENGAKSEPRGRSPSKGVITGPTTPLASPARNIGHPTTPSTNPGNSGEATRKRQSSTAGLTVITTKHNVRTYG